ncbi:MAG: hypothetical protein M3R15_03635 [Acidobacteriota bacterium]|nr:hypothetical protein [Acidobacteriota bacterium]
MFAGDVFIDRKLTSDEIANAMSKLLSISPAEVLVVDDITKLESRLGEDIHVLCEQVPMKGDFSVRIANYLRDAGLEKFVEQIGNEALTGQFCDELDCRCLISDDSVNPYSWLLVQGTGDVQSVSIDAHRSDEDEGEIFINHPVAHQDNVSHVA